MPQGNLFPIQVAKHSEKPKARDAEEAWLPGSRKHSGNALEPGSYTNSKLLGAAAQPARLRHTQARCMLVTPTGHCVFLQLGLDVPWGGKAGCLTEGSALCYNHSIQINSNPYPQKKLPKYSNMLVVCPRILVPQPAVPGSSHPSCTKRGRFAAAYLGPSPD